MSLLNLGLFLAVVIPILLSSSHDEGKKEERSHLKIFGRWSQTQLRDYQDYSSLFFIVIVVVHSIDWG